MKWTPRDLRWRITFAGGRIDIVWGETPEVAAAKIVRIYFGRKVHARRIEGRRGEPGAFEAIGRQDEALTVFDVDPMGG